MNTSLLSGVVEDIEALPAREFHSGEWAEVELLRARVCPPPEKAALKGLLWVYGQHKGEAFRAKEAVDLWPRHAVNLAGPCMARMTLVRIGHRDHEEALTLWVDGVPRRLEVDEEVVFRRGLPVSVCPAGLRHIDPNIPVVEGAL